MLQKTGQSKEKIIIRKVRCMLNYLLNLFKAIFNNEGLKEKEEEEVKPKVDLKNCFKVTFIGLTLNAIVECTSHICFAFLKYLYFVHFVHD